LFADASLCQDLGGDFSQSSLTANPRHVRTSFTAPPAWKDLSNFLEDFLFNATLTNLGGLFPFTAYMPDDLSPNPRPGSQLLSPVFPKPVTNIFFLRRASL
jgi:hypothetical protein